MKFRFHRIAVAATSLALTFLALNQIEKIRATQIPSGWKRTHGEQLELHPGPPRVGNSVWRIGPNTVWQTTTSAEQLYFRPIMNGPLGISLATNGEDGLWIWLHPDQPSTATLNGVPLKCMGQLMSPDAVQPVEITKQKEGVLVRWGDERMVCPAAPLMGTPALKTQSKPLNLMSIGRDRQSDGVPLSLLWWMSGLMIGGFLGMVTLDLLLAIKRTFLRSEPSPKEE